MEGIFQGTKYTITSFFYGFRSLTKNPCLIPELIHESIFTANFKKKYVKI